MATRAPRLLEKVHSAARRRHLSEHDYPDPQNPDGGDGSAPRTCCRALAFRWKGVVLYRESGFVNEIVRGC